MATSITQRCFCVRCPHGPCFNGTLDFVLNGPLSPLMIQIVLEYLVSPDSREENYQFLVLALPPAPFLIRSQLTDLENYQKVNVRSRLD